MAMNRTEHLVWCKQRACEYLERGEVIDAVTSMLFDLRKHPETKPDRILAMLGMFAAKNGDVVEVRRFIDGFN